MKYLHISKYHENYHFLFTQLLKLLVSMRVRMMLVDHDFDWNAFESTGTFLKLFLIGGLVSLWSGGFIIFRSRRPK